MVFDHIKELIASQAVLIANSEDELIVHVAAALADPSIRLTQRRAHVHHTTHGLLGKATETCAQSLIQLAQHPQSQI